VSQGGVVVSRLRLACSKPGLAAEAGAYNLAGFAGADGLAMNVEPYVHCNPTCLHGEVDHRIICILDNLRNYFVA
jgi:hypothetical protein